MPKTLKKTILFQALLAGLHEDVYILEAKSLALLAASDSVLRTTGQTLLALQALPIERLLHVSRAVLLHHLQTYLIDHQQPVDKPLSTVVNGDQAQFKMLYVNSDDVAYVVLVRDERATQQTLALANEQHASRYLSMINNAPGMFCQFHLDAQSQMHFDYVSAGSEGLLGCQPHTLMGDHQVFYQMINAKDKADLRSALKRSRKALKPINWSGRFWIDAWKDTKWVNLRSTPKALDNGDIQWDGFLTNITKTTQEKVDLQASRQRLSELTAHINHIREDERHRIACEIHDDLGGNMTAIKLGLAAIRQSVGAEATLPQQKLDDVEAIVDGTYEAIHRICSDLRPNIIELGIVEALNWQAKEFEKQTGVSCQFFTNQQEIDAPRNHAMALFRICQEAMNNIAKYAKASQVFVNLEATEAHLKMLILDNGIGIKPIDQIKENSFGLQGMQERATALHGQFKISGLRGDKKGTKVSVILPRD